MGLVFSCSTQMACCDSAFFFLISHSLDWYLTADIRFPCAVRAGTRVESLQKRLQQRRGFCVWGKNSVRWQQQEEEQEVEQIMMNSSSCSWLGIVVSYDILSCTSFACVQYMGWICRSVLIVFYPCEACYCQLNLQGPFQAGLCILQRLKAWTLILAGVGKSCLLLRFSDDTFTTSFITTIGYVDLIFVGRFCMWNWWQAGLNAVHLWWLTRFLHLNCDHCISGLTSKSGSLSLTIGS